MQYETKQIFALTEIVIDLNSQVVLEWFLIIDSYKVD